MSLATNLGSGTSAKGLLCIHPLQAATPSERNATLAHRLRHHAIRHHTMMIAVVVQVTMTSAVVVQGLHHAGAGSKLATAVGAMTDTAGGGRLNLHALPMRAVVEFTSLEMSPGSGTFARALRCMRRLPAASPLRRRTAKKRSCPRQREGQFGNGQ